MKKKDKLNYYKFLNSLPKKINKLYFKKLAGKFKLVVFVVINALHYLLLN